MPPGRTWSWPISVELLADSTEDLHRAGSQSHRLRAAAQRIIAATEDYPADPWRLVEHAYNPAYVEQTETLFALSNGYLGMRGQYAITSKRMGCTPFGTPASSSISAKTSAEDGVYF